MPMIWGKTKYYQFCLQVSIFPCIICWKDFFLFGILVKNHLTVYVRFFFSGLSSFLHLYACLMCCFNCCSKPQIRKYDFFNFDLFKVALNFQDPFKDSPYEFKIDFSISKTKTNHWDFDGHCPKSVNLYLTIGNINNLISSLPNHEHKGYFYKFLL